MKQYWIVAIALLAWNLAGLAAFVMQMLSNPKDLGDPITAHAFASTPAWVWAAYALATIAGTAGAIALLMRRKAATSLFALSLAGVILQFGWTILIFGIVQQKGLGAIHFPIAIALIAWLGLAYGRRATRRGILA